MPRPPATLTLRYCVTCNRHHWPSGTGETPDYHYRGTIRCPGAVQTLTYRLDAGQPEPSCEAQPEPQYEYRAAFRTHDGRIGYSVGSESAPMSEEAAWTLRVPGGWVERAVARGPWERLDVPDTTKET